MTDSNFYRDELYQMRENYRNKPLRDINLSRPAWLSSSDPMYKVFYQKSKLLQHGEITYASIVQANSILFRRFPSHDCPAHIFFSTDSFIAENPEVLFTIASKISTYKGQAEDQIPDEWKEVARVITDEYDRTGFTFSLELDIGSIEFHMIPTMIFRKLLPKSKLCGRLLPILTEPDCKQILVLPRKYWTKEYTKAWVNGAT